MKLVNAIIYSLAINKIDSVYLIGKAPNYYKMYLSEKGNNSIRINLDGKLGQNFWKIANENIPRSHLTNEISVQQAIEYLSNIKKNNEESNKKLLNTIISILKIKNFSPIKKKIKNKLPFYFWIREQINRDDLIGDIAYDIINDGSLGYWSTFKNLKSHVAFHKNGPWNITSFRDADREGAVDPSLCLKLAKIEYDLITKKKKLSKFIFRNRHGFVYFLKQIDGSGPIKIGRARDIERRIKQIQTSLPYNLESVGSIETQDYYMLEKKVQLENKNRHIKREWYDLKLSEVVNIIHNYQGEVSINCEKYS